MAYDRPVIDEEILAGFASLHQAMATGFDRLEKRCDALQNDVLDARNDIARLEGRMLRRFDDVDARFDDHERRISALESRT